MSDEFETLLRDHFRHASERIHPGPEMIERARAAGHRRIPFWWPRFSAVAAGATGLVAAGGLAVLLTMIPGSPAAHRSDPVASSGAQVTLRAAQRVVPVGGEIRFTGTANGRVELFLRVGESWTRTGDAMPANGRYSMTVIAPAGTRSARACLAGSSICSATLRLTVGPSPIPTPTPTQTGVHSPNAVAPPGTPPATPKSTGVPSGVPSTTPLPPTPSRTGPEPRPT